MSKRSAMQDSFYRDAVGGAGAHGDQMDYRWNTLKRTPYAAWAMDWEDEADACARPRQVTHDEGKRMACAWQLKDACRRLDERTRSRWDLPEGYWYHERLLDRIWRLEAEAEDAADFFELIKASEAPNFRCAIGRGSGYLNAYTEAQNARGVYTSGLFPRRAYWPEDDIRVYADALKLARWTLEALKERHRRGADPKSPLTLEGQELVTESLKRQPHLTADELKAGLAPYAPQDDAKDGEAEEGER